MKTSQQDHLLNAQGERPKNRRALSEQALKSLRDYRRARFAERRLIAQVKAA